MDEGEREAVLEAIAMSSEGGLRDAEVVLDQLISLEDEITLEKVQQLLGIVESALLRECVEKLLERDTAHLLGMVNELVDRGRDLQRFVKTLLNYLRDLLVLKAGSEPPRNADLAGELAVVAQKVSIRWIRKAAHKSDELMNLLRRNIQKSIALDSLILELRGPGFKR